MRAPRATRESRGPDQVLGEGVARRRRPAVATALARVLSAMRGVHAPPLDDRPPSCPRRSGVRDHGLWSAIDGVSAGWRASPPSPGERFGGPRLSSMHRANG